MIQVKWVGGNAHAGPSCPARAVVRPLQAMSKRSLLIGSIAFAVGGLAPMATGIVGLHGYFTEGHFIAKTGQVVSGTTAWVASSVFILAGLGMMALALWQYRRHASRSPESE